METIRQISAVSAVLLLLAAALWWLRRNGLARAGRASRAQLLLTVDRLALSPQHSLHLVQLAGRGLLVATSPAGCTLLETFAWESLESSPAAREAS